MDIIRGSFKKYVDFFHNVFSRRHITLRFVRYIWTTNSVDLKYNFLNLTRYFRKKLTICKRKIESRTRFGCVVYAI